MCGIVGLVGRAPDPELLRRMSARLHHRGPDDAGESIDAETGVALAMRRLAILDLDGGRQPMTSADGALTLVFNGEIFNAPELRRGLEQRGRAFQTSHSDTECLLRLYEERGEAMVGELNGMFAFAIHDRRRGVVFGARDRFGIKPLYLAESGGRLAFASEMKALLQLPWLERALDPQSLLHYMRVRYVPGERSILRGVRRLPPGAWFRWEVAPGRLETGRYWRPRWTPDRGIPADEWPERIREALRGAVRRWVWSDVPVACSLSGGLDSTSIVGVLGELGGPRLRTYALGFRAPGEEPWDETALARQVAERWGADHHELTLSPDALLDDLVAMVWALDEPYGGGLPSWTVFRFMAQDVKVGLTGTGGDELFGGYGKWRPWERRPWTGGPRHWLKTLAARLPEALVGAERRDALRAEVGPFAGPADAYPLYGGARPVRPVASEALVDTREWLEAAYAETGAENARDGFGALDLGAQLPDEFLLMTDRFSMAHSLEARTPFLDGALVDEVLRIPAALRTRPGDLKHLLRAAVGELLPAPVRAAPKRGFVLPDALWLRGPLRPLVERLLGRERLRSQGLLPPQLYDERVAPFLAGRREGAGELWALLMFQLWHAVFVEQGCREAPGWTWRDLT